MGQLCGAMGWASEVHMRKAGPCTEGAAVCLGSWWRQAEAKLYLGAGAAPRSGTGDAMRRSTWLGCGVRFKTDQGQPTTMILLAICDLCFIVQQHPCHA